jgi:hypothetical protein
MNRFSRSSLVVFIGAVAMPGCAAQVDGSEVGGGEQTAVASSAVQTAYETFGGFEIDTSSPTTNPTLAATGVVFAPLRHNDGTPWIGTDGSPMRAPCGVTFISSHYAVTAAHCVDSTDVPTTSTMMTVQQLDISAASWPAVRATANESSPYGTSFPAWSFGKLAATDGYKATEYSRCHVVQRCSYGNIACAADGDVALLRCDDRPWFSPSVPVAASDDQVGGVSMQWFHEVLGGIPTSPPVLSGTKFGWFFYAEQEDRYAHYTLYPPSDPAEGADQYFWNQNFHYYGGEKTQLLPLRSTDFRTGDLFWNPKRLGYDASRGVVWTDLFGCHGTSGSGIFQWVTRDGTHYTPQLLGPVSAGGVEAFGSNLCIQYQGLAGSGKAQLGYPPLWLTQLIAKTAANDTLIHRWPIGLTTTTSSSLTSALANAPTSLYAGPPVRALRPR